jgi:hypothetical protein
MNTRLFIAAVMIAFCANIAFAQSSNDYHKWEVSGGYSHSRVQSTIGNEVVPQRPVSSTWIRLAARVPHSLVLSSRKSFVTEVAFNFTRYFGVKGNFSGYFKLDRFLDTFPPMSIDLRRICPSTILTIDAALD